MLKVVVKKNLIQFGERFILSLQRTLRIPNDGKVYPLPPGLGNFPIYKTSDYRGSIPKDWNTESSYFIPMYQREALWLSFTAEDWKPNAVKIDIGKVNAVSGESESDSLHSKPQNYLVCPRQLWLDGINAGHGTIRQFVAMPLGLGDTVEAYVSGKEEYGAIEIKIFEAKDGVFPNQPPEKIEALPVRNMSISGTVMGIAAGGQMKQKIYPDSYGVDVWDLKNYGVATIHIVNSEQFNRICGHKSQSTPIDAAVYTKNGFPWFDLYEENEADLAPPKTLVNIKGLDDSGALTEINIKNSQVNKLGKEGE